MADRAGMNRPLATVVATAFAAFATVSVRAQEPAPTEQRDQGRLEERAKSMREQIDTGKQVKSHVRVSVRLKNGNKLTGVVKDGRFVERVDGLRFVDAQAQDRGAGIRLWYTSGIRNYVFVPFGDFAEYQVLQRLSKEQLEELEHELQQQEGRRAEREAEAARAAAAAKARDGKGTEGEPVADTPPAPGQEGVASKPDAEAKKGKTEQGKEAQSTEAQSAEAPKPAVMSEEQKQWFSLLQTYPPAAGWGKARRDEISRRLAVVGAKPSEMEQKFVTQFAAWEEACTFFAVDAEAPPAGDPAPAPATETNGRKKAKKK